MRQQQHLRRHCTSVSTDLWLGAKSWHLTCLSSSILHTNTHTHTCITLLPRTYCTLQITNWVRYFTIHQILRVYFKIISVKLSHCTGGQLFLRWNRGRDYGPGSVRLFISWMLLIAFLMKICGTMYKCSALASSQLCLMAQGSTTVYVTCCLSHTISHLTPISDLSTARHTHVITFSLLYL